MYTELATTAHPAIGGSEGALGAGCTAALKEVGAFCAVWDTPLGPSMWNLMKTFAILIVILAAVLGIKYILAGKAGKAIGLILGTAVAVVFLWAPHLADSMILLFSKLADEVVNSGGEIAPGLITPDSR